jgi:hypothetical protein
MQIDFASSGGFANLQLAYRGDTDTMPEEQAQELERLVNTSGVFDMGQGDLNTHAAPGRADAISYRLTISDGLRRTSLRLNDVNAPASVRPLLALLRKLAIEHKKPG